MPIYCRVYQYTKISGFVMQLKRKTCINETSNARVILIFNTEGVCIDMQTSGLFMLPITRSDTIGSYFDEIHILNPLSQIYSIGGWLQKLKEPGSYEYSYVSNNEYYQLSVELVNISNCFLQISLENKSSDEFGTFPIKLQSGNKVLLNNMLNAYALFKLKSNGILTPENCIIIDINRKFEEIVSQERDYIIGKSVVEIFPVSFSGLIKKLSDVNINKTKTEFSIFLTEFNKHLHVTAYSPAKNYFGLIIEDDTIKNKYLSELIHSNKLHDILAESTLEAILVFSESKCIACNTAAKKMFQVSGKDFDTLNIYNLFDAEYIDAVFNRIADNDTNPFILMLKSLEGSQFPAELRITQADYNSIKLNIIAVRDISQLKGIEEDLVESEERYRNIVDSLCDAVFSTDTSGNIVYLSSSYSTLTGISTEKLINSHIKNLFLEDDSNALSHQFSNLEYNSFAHEYRLICAEKTSKWAKVITFPFKKDNVLLGFNGVITDINTVKEITSEKNELQKQLMQTQKMEALGVLAGGIAHDFNNILSVIIGYAEISEYELNRTSEVISALREIQVAGNRARALVKQILSFSRKKIEEVGPVMVKPIMKEVVKLIRSSAPASVRIITDIHLENQIIAEPTKIHQILMNLCTNSLYAVNRETGEIRVSLKETDFDNVPLSCRIELEDCSMGNDYNLDTVLEIKVSDNGCGIPEENLKKVMEPYFTTKPVNHGTGLGLSIVHSIVKSFNGSLNIGSTLNKGTAIRVFFPICRQKSHVDSTFEQENLTMKGLRILYVDDESSLGYIFNRRMRRAGCIVKVHTNPIIAVREVIRNPEMYDLIVCDIGMPQMTGYQFYENLRNNKIDIPFILCTGYNTEIQKQFTIKWEIPETVTKPINFNNLLCYLKKSNFNKKILS